MVQASVQLPRSFQGTPPAQAGRSPHPRLYGSVQAGRAKRARLEDPASQQPVWPPRPATGTPMPAQQASRAIAFVPSWTWRAHAALLLRPWTHLVLSPAQSQNMPGPPLWQGLVPSTQGQAPCHHRACKRAAGTQPAGPGRVCWQARGALQAGTWQACSSCWASVVGLWPGRSADPAGAIRGPARAACAMQ